MLPVMAEAVSAGTTAIPSFASLSSSSRLKLFFLSVSELSSNAVCHVISVS